MKSLYSIFAFGLLLVAYLTGCVPDSPNSNNTSSQQPTTSSSIPTTSPANTPTQTAAPPHQNPENTTPTSSPKGPSNSQPTREELPDANTPTAPQGPVRYHGKNVIYTKHAICRMGCRHIDASEVQEILDKGAINDRKSDRNDRPCPTYALEGRTHDGQKVRIVVADCDNTAKLVTVIDLENDFQCHCD